MARLFGKQYHTPGTAPGTLRRPSETTPRDTGSPPVWRAAIFANGECDSLTLSGADELGALTLHPAGKASAPAKPGELAGAGPAGASLTWVDIQGTPSADDLHLIGTQFGLHPLAQEDVLNGGQRPKAESFGEILAVTLGIPTEDEDRSISIRQLSIFVGDGFVLSIVGGFVLGSGAESARSSGDDPFAETRRRLAAPGSATQPTTEHILYALIDAAVDHAFPALDTIGERIESLELAILERPDNRTLEDLHAIKRELIILRRHLWPTRDVINQLLRDHAERFTGDTLIWMRDVYDHTIQIMDLIESYRDMTASLLDVYLSSMSNRTNESMRTLTVIATIFMPLTFIVGVYGMNFHNPDSPFAMPELTSYYGYPLVWLFMALLAGVMIWLFKRNRWF
ncbi:magnesium/cobalt transporter CorA [Fodinicurvata sp. EGI_FJ10296]|uniref:magnesium/cobalt transporter CorA n=1 Tax=Fodinicurvata sp. EGI_FJ10296 TaxID=3231908 RepID=UPI003455983D